MVLAAGRKAKMGTGIFTSLGSLLFLSFCHFFFLTFMIMILQLLTYYLYVPLVGNFNFFGIILQEVI